MSLTTAAKLFSIIFFFFLIFPARASELEAIVSTRFDASTIAKGYTLESSDGLMRLGIRPGALIDATTVDIKTLNPLIMEDTLDDFQSLTSDSPPSLLGNIYLFDILNKESYDGSVFFFLEIKYPSSEVGGQKSEVGLHGRRRAYFYNGVSGSWEELPSIDNPQTQSVRALIHLPYARLAIFEEEIPEIGEASWYAYKECDCAASPDYPKGTLLWVTSIEDPAKSVEVVINDYGPDRLVHPGRIIDLDRVAFAKLASLGLGLINVRLSASP